MAPRLCSLPVSGQGVRTHRPLEAAPAVAPAVVETDTRLLEAVLQAWSDCKPHRQVLLLDQVIESLHRISSCIPGAKASLHVRLHLRDFFRADGNAQGHHRTFLQRLSAEGGEVHFLYFWRAFSEVARIVDSLQKNSQVPSSREAASDSPFLGSPRVVQLLKETTDCAEDSLASQLESFRDKALGLLRIRVTKKEWGREMSGLTGPTSLTKQRIALSALRELLRKATMQSNSAEFWEACTASLSDYDGFAELNLEQLTTLMLTWLDRATTGEWDNANMAPCSYIPAVDALRPAAGKCAARQNTWESLQDLQEKTRASSSEDVLAGSSLQAEIQPPDEGIAVFLNVYDAFFDKSIHWMNSLLAPESSEWRLGGAFHTGVEVNGMEWSYGFSGEGETGVAWNLPKDHHQHRFRQSILLGHTQLSPDLIMDVLTDMCEEYVGSDYHMLRNNCCHFADDFCRRLAVGGIPTWLHRLARIFGNAEGLVLGLTKGIASCTCSNLEMAENKDEDKAQWLYRL